MPNDQYMNYQEGGEMKPVDKTSGGGDPVIDPSQQTIDIKIKLVADATLPSYLVPILDCTKDGSTTKLSTGSKVNVTLSGANLQQAASPTGFTCEITSNFLSDTEKSAITIETYYVDTGGGGGGGGGGATTFKNNIIYFDESLLLSYNNTGKLIKSKTNPFSATAGSGTPGTYTFEFDFDKIIKAIQALSSYKQIQNMFMFVNNIDASIPPPSTCLIKISADAFLNLKFSGVPFTSTLVKYGPVLKIDTTQPETTGCTFDSILPDNIKIIEKLKQVLVLPGYTFDCSVLVSKQVAAAAAAAAAAATGKGPVAKPADIDAYKFALNAYNEAVKTGDPANINHAQAGLNAALQKPGIAEHLQEQKKLANSSTIGDANDLSQVHNAYDAKIGIAIDTAPGADHSSNYTKLNAALKVPAVLKHFGLNGNPVVTAAQQQQQLQQQQQQLQQQQQGSANATGGTGFGSTIVGKPGESGQCGNGDVSMKCDTAGKRLILEVPYSSIIRDCFGPNLSSAFAQSVIQANKEGGGGGAAAAASAASTALSKAEADLASLTTNGASQAEIDAAKAEVAKAAAAVPKPNASGNTPAVAQTKISNISEIKPPPGAPATPQTYEMAQDQFIQQGLDLFNSFTTASATLSGLESSIKTANLPDIEIPEILKIARAKFNEADRLKNKIIKDATSNTSMIKAVATSGMSLITLAPDAINAYQKINEAVELVNQAKTQVEAAIKKKDSEKTAEIDASKQAELTQAENDLKDQEAKLATAKNDIIGITSPPPNLTSLEQEASRAIQTASVALLEAKGLVNDINSAPVEKKVEAVKIAIDKIENVTILVVAAATDVQELVDEIANEKKKPVVVPDYGAYKKAYEAYTTKKSQYDAALEQVKRATERSDAGGAKVTPTSQEIDDADAALESAVKDISSQIVPAITGISDKILTDEEFTNILKTDDLKTKEVKKLTTATDALDSALGMINDALKVHTDAISEKDDGLGDEEESGGFSLFDGGSKPKSKSSSSKSKSSSPKNKTKKNHSAPKSNKSKTPKIIMNE